MLTYNTKYLRAATTAAFAAAFTAVAFIFTFAPGAKMQSGSNTIVFERYDDTAGVTKIFVMNADGTNIIDLGQGFSPVWSADGQKIAYSDGTSEQYDIWTMNADGSERTRLTQNYRSYGPAWSPDGAKIAFVSDHESGYHVYVVNADGSGQQRLAVTATEVRQEYAPTWTPDSSKVIFLGAKVISGLSRNDYYQASADGTGTTTQITFLNALLAHDRPAVSPDGSRIVFEYQHDLQAALTDGSGQMINISNNGAGTDEEADYAPNGAQIVFRRGDMLMVMNADGSEAASLNVEGDRPDWNPTAILPGATPTPTATETATPTPAVPSSDISIEATTSAPNVPVGSQVTLTATIRNIGPNVAHGVTLGSTSLSPLTLVSILSSQGSCSMQNGGIVCPFGEMPTGTAITVTLRARVNTAGQTNVQFSGAALEFDPVSDNNSATVSVNGNGAPCAQTVQTPYQVFGSHWLHDRRNGRDVMVMALRNRSNQTLPGRLVFAFDNLPTDVSIDPRVVAGRTQCAQPLNSPYIVVNAGSQGWRPNQIVIVTVPFINPRNRTIPMNWRLFSGNVNP